MTQEAHKEPARSLIEKFGDGDLAKGVGEIARATGRDRSRVYRWMYSEERGGTDGLIPQQNFLKIMRAGQELGIEVPHAAFTNAN